jgi:hypothetical protein
MGFDNTLCCCTYLKAIGLMTSCIPLPFFC